MPEQLMSELDVIELPDGTSHKVKGDVISVLIPRKDRKCWVVLHLQISRDKHPDCSPHASLAVDRLLLLLTTMGQM
jgi:hypothetical protein|tara:strand:+ start:38 stop:265 length:228 start_codon:yes stop_codon:yes gene_type:complete